MSLATTMGMPEPGTDNGEVPSRSAMVGVLPTSAREKLSAHGAVRAVALTGAVLTVWVASHYVATIVFASWFVTVLWPWRERLVARTKKPHLTALLLTSGICLAIIVPLTITGILVGVTVSEWIQDGVSALKSGNFRSLFATVLGGDGRAANVRDLAREGAKVVPSVLAGVGSVFQRLIDFVISIFLFIVGLYSFLVEGRWTRAFIEQASPLRRYQTRYLMAAYADTGRGMLIGVFLVIIVHAVVAVIGYAIIGIPRALELGTLTALAGLLPGIGTGFVWIPLAITMMVTGHVGQGIGVLAVGAVVGLADNVLRPYLAKLGNVPLPTFALFVAIFGGIAMFGPSGLLLGPMIVALGKAALELHIEDKERAALEAGEEPP